MAEVVRTVRSGAKAAVEETRTPEGAASFVVRCQDPELDRSFAMLTYAIAYWRKVEGVAPIPFGQRPGAGSEPE